MALIKKKVRCDTCGKKVEKDETTYLKGKRVCASCHDMLS
jgi:formylmethanofuran dehydrogenase subunit E